MTGVDPPGRIPGKFLIASSAGDSWDLRDPIFPEQFIGIAVLGGEGPYLGVIHRCQATVADHRVFRAVLRLYHQGCEEEMDVKVAIKKPAFP